MSGNDTHLVYDIAKLLVSTPNSIGQHPRWLASFSHHECSCAIIVREVADLPLRKLGPHDRVCSFTAPDLVLTQTARMNIEVVLLKAAINVHLRGGRNPLSRRGGEPVDHDLSVTNLAGLAI